VRKLEESSDALRVDNTLLQRALTESVETSRIDTAAYIERTTRLQAQIELLKAEIVTVREELTAVCETGLVEFETREEESRLSDLVRALPSYAAAVRRVAALQTELSDIRKEVFKIPGITSVDRLTDDILEVVRSVEVTVRRQADKIFSLEDRLSERAELLNESKVGLGGVGSILSRLIWELVQVYRGVCKAGGEIPNATILGAVESLGKTKSEKGRGEDCGKSTEILTETPSIGGLVGEASREEMQLVKMFNSSLSLNTQGGILPPPTQGVPHPSEVIHPDVVTSTTMGRNTEEDSTDQSIHTNTGTKTDTGDRGDMKKVMSTESFSDASMDQSSEPHTSAAPVVSCFKLTEILSDLVRCTSLALNRAVNARLGAPGGGGGLLVTAGSTETNSAAQLTELQDQVVRLRAMLATKREQISTLRSVLRANKATAELGLGHLKVCAISQWFNYLICFKIIVGSKQN